MPAWQCHDYLVTLNRRELICNAEMVRTLDCRHHWDVLLLTNSVTAAEDDAVTCTSGASTGF